MTPKSRQLLLVVILSIGMPFAILAAQFAGATLPLIPACLMAGLAFAAYGYLLTRSVWKLVRD